MEYIYLLFIIILYFPIILADKLGSEGAEQKAVLFKYSFYRSLTGIACGAIILIFTGCRINIDLYTVLTSSMFGIMLALCMLVTFYSMQVTTVAISSVFKAASVILPCVFGAVFGTDSINFVNAIGFVLFLLSVYLIVSKTQEKKTKFGIKAFFACLGVLLTNGFGSISMQLFGRLVPGGEEAVFMFFSYCVQSAILLVIYLTYSVKHKNCKVSSISKKIWIYGAIGTVVAFLAQQIMTGLTSSISSLIIFPVTMGSSVIMGVVVGWLCFKEKLTARSMIGIVGGIISLIMINVF